MIQCDYGLNSRQDFFDAMKNVAMRHKFHPIKDLLNSFQWDGREHIRSLLPEYLGAEDSDYTYQVMRLWMLGAVARIFRSGCKFDYCMILQGAQGVGKSTLPRLMTLDDSWFSDSLDSLDTDRSAQSLIGGWICELAELKSLARTTGGMESVKKFLTATQDRFRQPYERRADTYLRSCVFMGTTNKSDFLSDQTGNRRFLIVKVGEQKPEKNLFDESAMEDIRQSWAEAVYIWKNEKPTLIFPESLKQEAEQAQNDNMADDGSSGIIEAYLEDQTKVCAIQVWQEALGQSGTPSKWKAAKINSIISKVPGWAKIKIVSRFGKYGSQRGYEGLFGMELQMWERIRDQDLDYADEDFGAFQEPMSVIDQEEALKLYDAGADIYLITNFSSPIYVTERMEIERGPEHYQMSMTELERFRNLEWEMQKYPQIQSLKEANLLLGTRRTFGIYQIKDDSPGENYAFMNMRFIESHLEYFATECDEFHDMGAYEKSTDVNQIAAVYEKYRENPETAYLGCSMGIIYRDPEDSYYDKAEFAIVKGNTVFGNLMDDVRFYGELALVREGIEKIHEALPDYKYVPMRDVREAMYPEKMTTEQLAEALDEIAEAFDPYEYRDNVEPGENTVQEVMLDLQSGNTHSYISYLKDIVDEECDLSVRAGVLMERLKAYEPELPKDMEPMVYVNYCEKSELGNPRCQKLSDLDSKTVEQDKAWYADRDPNTNEPKTTAQMFFTVYYAEKGDKMLHHFQGKIDIGSGNGGIISQLKMQNEMKLTDESWISYQQGKGNEEYQKYMEDLTDMQNHVLPYLQSFCSLEEKGVKEKREQQVAEKNESREAVPRAGVEINTAVKDAGKAERKAITEKKAMPGKEKKPSIHERLEINKRIIQEKISWREELIWV